MVYHGCQRRELHRVVINCRHVDVGACSIAVAVKDGEQVGGLRGEDHRTALAHAEYPARTAQKLHRLFDRRGLEQGECLQQGVILCGVELLGTPSSTGRADAAWLRAGAPALAMASLKAL